MSLKNKCFGLFLFYLKCTVEQSYLQARSVSGGTTREAILGPARGGMRETDPHSYILAIDWWNI